VVRPDVNCGSSPIVNLSMHVVLLNHVIEKVKDIISRLNWFHKARRSVVSGTGGLTSVRKDIPRIMFGKLQL
jgi:hypothetical protein